MNEHASSEQRQTAAFSGSAMASGAAIGGMFALSAAILVGGLLFVAVISTIAEMKRPILIAGGVGCMAALFAFLSALLPSLRMRVAAPLMGAAFVAVAGYAGYSLAHDLGLITYSKRTHDSLRLEDIAAESPSRLERSNYRLYYAVRDRIAGSELAVQSTFPLDDWHLLYRGDLASVERSDGTGLPSAPTADQVERWLASGGLELTILDNGRLVLPPELTKRRAPESKGGSFAVVQTEQAGTYALVATQGSSGE
jgi:hypothetical protein